jgi:hypothetical protein
MNHLTFSKNNKRENYNDTYKNSCMKKKITWFKFPAVKVFFFFTFLLRLNVGNS